MTKAELRSVAKTLRNAIPRDTVESLSDIIRDKLFSTPEYVNAKSIFCYVSFGSEVMTDEIIQRALLDGKTVTVPRVRGDVMDSIRITSDTEWRVGAFGIREPIGGEEYISELAIVPMLAFNDTLHRIGYGRGYYDKFLSEDTVKIGLSYAQMRVDFVGEAHDVPLDVIITEKEILR